MKRSGAQGVRSRWYMVLATAVLASGLGAPRRAHGARWATSSTLAILSPAARTSPEVSEPSPALVASPVPASGVPPIQEEGSGADDAEGSSVVVIPLVARTEETSWQFGGAGIYLFASDEEEVPRSNVTASALVSVRKQFTASLGASAYLFQDNLRLSTTLDAFLWPTEFFLQGVESEVSEKYSFTGSKGRTTATWRWAESLFGGPSFKYSVQKNDVPSEGVMQDADLRSLNGHSSLGPGWSVAWDSRDIPYAPARGTYVAGAVHHLFGVDGRTGGFFDIELAARQYFSVDSTRNIFAFALELRGVQGEPPFALMPTSDGTTVLRGMRRARYYDDWLATAQFEYRRELGRVGPTGPWGMTVFAEAGQFYESLNRFARGQLVTSIGAGLRYLVIPEERVALRLDVAYVDAGVGVVLNAMEAF